MAAKSETVNAAVGQQVNITRVFDAPRELVFRMWTDPKYVEMWWGPKDFTNPVCQLDGRVGGKMRIVMQDPGGTKYFTHGVFNEIVEFDRIVFTNVKEDDSGGDQLEVLNSVTFSDENGKTRMTLNALVVMGTPEACKSIEGMNMGWNQSIDRFAENLQRLIHKS